MGEICVVLYVMWYALGLCLWGVSFELENLANSTQFHGLEVDGASLGESG